MKDVLCLILGGGRGSRLFPLTLRRSEPAVPIAGKYRLIDIPVSNCLNSGINRIYVLTQFLSVSLHRHISNTYTFDPFSQGYVEVLAAQQTNEATAWYQGTADAIRQHLRYIQADPGQHVLLLYGDQLYRMDFEPLVRMHRETRADMTLAVTPVSAEMAGNFGIVNTDDESHVVEFVEKPRDAQTLARLQMPAGWFAERGLDGTARPFLASMGIYMFRRDFLLSHLTDAMPAVDVVGDVLTKALRSANVSAYLFTGYWDDLGTVRSYYEANLALLADSPPFDFHSDEGVIFTRARNLPASHVDNARVERSLISDGCFIARESNIIHSLIGVRSKIGPGVRIADSLVLGAHRYESEAEIESNRKEGVPPIGIGAGSVIQKAIIDKDCRIGKNVRILNEAGLEHHDGASYMIREGIVVVPDGSVLPDNTAI